MRKFIFKFCKTDYYINKTFEVEARDEAAAFEIAENMANESTWERAESEIDFMESKEVLPDYITKLKESA